MAHGIETMSGDKIIIDSMNRKFRIPAPISLTNPPNNIQFARKSKPWKIYFEMLSTVLPAFFLLYTSLFIIIGIINFDPLMTLSGGFCSLPLLMILLRLHRPNLIHVQVATPVDDGNFIHSLPGGGSINTIVKTHFKRFIVRDDSVLEMPPSKQLWMLFSIVLGIGILSSFIFLSQNSQDIGLILFVIVALPLWLIGFSLPVLAWWGTSTQSLGMPTKKRDAESWLLAGMAAAFPAFIFNSFVAPSIIPNNFPSWANELAILAISAPLCEELFKGLAIAFFLPLIKGPKHGFQIGFTVGLGFALIENFQYVGLSLAGGPLGVTMTILVRGIGSIPAHAVWAGVTGTAIGWLSLEPNIKNKINNFSKINLINNKVNNHTNISNYKYNLITNPDSISPLGNNIYDENKPWLLLDKNSNIINENSHKTYDYYENSYSTHKETVYNKYENSGLMPPKSILNALFIAIFGHSFWNATSYMAYYLPESNNFNTSYVILISIVWTIFLVLCVLYIAIQLLRGVRSIDIPN